MNEIKCKNCQNSFTGNFCSNCGQRHIGNKRLQMREVINDFFDNTFNLHKGFFFTMWKLLITPGKVAHAYINGQRKSFSNPTRYMVIALAFQTFIDYWFKTTDIIENETYFYFSFLSEELNKSMQIWNVKLAVEYILLTNLFMIVLLPALFYFAFKALKLNYTELLTTSFYFFSTILFITMPFLFITKVLIGIYVSKEVIIVIFMSYLLWSNMQFFNKIHIWKRLLKIVLVIAVFMAIRVFCLPLIMSLINTLH